jgi:hypothetical protein
MPISKLHFEDMANSEFFREELSLASWKAMRAYMDVAPLIKACHLDSWATFCVPELT